MDGDGEGGQSILRIRVAVRTVLSTVHLVTAMTVQQWSIYKADPNGRGTHQDCPRQFRDDPEERQSPENALYHRNRVVNDAKSGGE